MRLQGPPPERLAPLDEHDIRESFLVMDESRTGAIGMDAVETLWLGLGYGQEERAEIERLVREEQTKQNKGEITVEVVLELFSKHSRNREEEIFSCFQLLDADHTGTISAGNLVELSRDMGEPLTGDEANAIMRAAPGETWNVTDFRNILSERSSARPISASDDEAL